ncbi:MAG: CehA/McbA family metallohydrolase [Oscillospiraceae bacterium]|nr:CehA/McbA family metallohydrolase [Oscillospiraceae bacterium]
MTLTLDLHIHSAASHDGRMTLAEIAERAKAAGLDGVAVCDHDAVLMDAPDDLGVLVIPGAEFSTEHGHLLGLFLTAPIEHRSIEETVAAIHAQGGLAVLAHPFERSRDADRLEPLAPLLDGIEVFNGRADRKIHDANALAQAFAAAHNLRPFAGSDAHLPREIGNGAVTLEAEAATLDAVKAALMTSAVTVRGRRGAALDVARSQLTKLQKRGAGPARYLKWALFACKCAAEDLFRGEN